MVRTSGSTGASKGVELSAAALRHSARASLDRLGARPGERWLCCLPVTHVAGLQVLVRSLVSGTEPVLAERADAETMAGSGCAHVSLVPTQLQRLLLEVSSPPMPLARFSSVLLGGAAAPAGLLDAARAAGVPVVTTYGMTETCGGCVYDGFPLDGTQVAIRSDDDGRPAESGRIWISGPVLFSRYRPGGYGGAGSPPVTGGSRGVAAPDGSAGSAPETWAAWTPRDGCWCAAGRMTSSTPAGTRWSPARWRRHCRPARVSRTWRWWGNPTPHGANGSSRWWCRPIRPTRRRWNCSVCMCRSGCRVTLLQAGS